jgi:hypothetical protein
MSEVLPLISVEAADEIAAAQIHVFQLAAKHTATAIDDQVLAFIQGNAEARRWFFDELLGLDSDGIQRMSIAGVPVGVIAAAQAAGISWLEIVSLVVKFGPQIRKAMELIREVIELLKSVSPSPSPVPDAKPEF